MKVVRPFQSQGNYTSVHNVVFDVMMPELPPNAFKTLCLILRKTVGWHKHTDQLSYAQLMQGTGIKSRSTMAAAIQDLLKRKYIIAHDTGDWEATSYSLNFGLEIEAPSTETVPAPSTETVPAPSTETVPAPSTETVPAPSTETVLTKERDQKKEKERARGGQDSAFDALFAAVASVSSLPSRMSAKQQSAVSDAVLSLLSAKATPEQVEAFMTYWRSDYNGLYKLRGQLLGRPHPGQIPEHWGQYMGMLEAKGFSGGGQSKRQAAAAAALARAADAARQR